MSLLQKIGTNLSLTLPTPDSLPHVYIRDKTLPNKSGVYFIFDHSNNLIYIGQSININHRIAAHVNSTPGSYYVSYLLIEDLKEMNIVELLYINFYKPKYNLHPPWKLSGAELVEYEMKKKLVEAWENEEYQRALEEGVKRSLI